MPDVLLQRTIRKGALMLEKGWHFQKNPLIAGEWTNHPSVAVYQGPTSTDQNNSRVVPPPVEAVGEVERCSEEDCRLTWKLASPRFA